MVKFPIPTPPAKQTWRTGGEPGERSCTKTMTSSRLCITGRSSLRPLKAPRGEQRRERKFPAGFKKCEEPSGRPGARDEAAMTETALVRGKPATADGVFSVGGGGRGWGRVFTFVYLGGRRGCFFSKVEAPFLKEKKDPEEALKEIAR